jgi:Uma2 family endonuclease
MPMDLMGIGKSAAIRIEPRIEPDERMSADEFFDFCQVNSDWQIERWADGEIVVMPPVGLDSGNYEVEAAAQLRNWARRDRRGKAYGPNTGFELPKGAMLAPDAAWVSFERLAALSPEQRRKFAPVCPEFVVEIQSPSDSVARLKRKMAEWIDNGAELAWLILPDAKTVLVYRPGAPVEAVEGAATIAGEGPVSGFELDLTDIWQV